LIIQLLKMVVVDFCHT